MKQGLVSLAALAVLTLGAGSVAAGDEELCLDCHEPSEDWQGLSPEEILATAKDTDIKRHADNAELSDEQLKAMIAQLLKQ